MSLQNFETYLSTSEDSLQSSGWYELNKTSLEWSDDDETIVPSEASSVKDYETFVRDPDSVEESLDPESISFTTFLEFVKSLDLLKDWIRDVENLNKSSGTRSSRSTNRASGNVRTRFDKESSLEKGPRGSQASAVWDKWRKVWIMAWKYDQKLKDKLEYLKELEKLKNFDWDEWRKRFLKHNNNKKSQIIALFQKLDDKGSNCIPRDQFVEKILKIKFQSSPMELNVVADKFDLGDGFIDWTKFVSELRPDWQDQRQMSNFERIDDEIFRQVALCTCKVKFRVSQAGEGKYKFGDAQKLCLVRIVRSTVMVRIGGGWCSVEEFLLKNDPCRGPSKVQLREKLTLGNGMSQAMVLFKPKISIEIKDTGI